MTHFIACPICGQARLEFARCPRAVYSACAAQPVSADGRRRPFGNVGLAGGLAGEYVDTGERYASQDCFGREYPAGPKRPGSVES